MKRYLVYFSNDLDTPPSYQVVNAEYVSINFSGALEFRNKESEFVGYFPKDNYKYFVVEDTNEDQSV